MEMPCTCPGCGDVVELNDMHRDPCDPTRTGLVCRECAEDRAVIEQRGPNLHRVVASGCLPGGPKVLVLQHADLRLKLPMGEFHRVTLQELKVIEDTRWAGGDSNG